MPNGSTGLAAEGMDVIDTGDGQTFVDTNVLVYAHDASESLKQPIARMVLDQLWRDRSGVVSTQVLQEFYAVATSKQKLAMTPAEAREVVGLYSAWPVVLLEPSLILNASRLQEQHAVAWWDALIIEAALVGGARRLLSEDLHDGRGIDHVRIVNPFSSIATPAGD
jgi:predicted nucleic acid-binding protein